MKQGLIKGPWSKQEDEILREYVKIYGSKNWNAVQRLTGLPRDGKSCRLRWLNQLDPYLKKGKFSEEEKQKILQLRQLGVEWCKIVKQLPGRTDNEIKNFFNINQRKKRKMENSNGECLKKKKNNLPLKDEIMKPHDNELNDNGESSMSGFNNQQQDISNTHEMVLIKDICNINHPSDSFHIPIIQPLNMICNNVASTSISNNSSPTFIDRGEAPFMPMGMVSYLPPLLEIESPLHSDTSIINNSSPTFIDRGEAPFMPIGMVSYLPPLPEIESPLHSHTSISNNSSPTFIDRGETSFIPMNMEPNLSPLSESINFQSFESPLIHKYPPLPLRSPEEIRQQQLEPDLPPPESINFQSLESPLIHKYPPLPLRSAEEIRQEQLEPDSPSNNGLLESMLNTLEIFWYTPFFV